MKNYYDLNELVEDLEVSKIVSKIVDNSKTIKLYWKIGEFLFTNGTDEQEMYNIAYILSNKYGNEYNYSNINNMIEFYLSFPELNKLSFNISWAVYKVLININNKNKRNYYYNVSLVNKLSANKLKKLIMSNDYERSKFYNKHNEIIVDDYSLNIFDVKITI